jgi:hypothetical protein
VWNIYLTTMASQKTPKRLYSDVSPGDTHSNDDKSEEIQTWPKVLVLESTDTLLTLSKLSPFVIQKTLQGCVGTVTDVKKLRTGVIVVEIQREGQAKSLLSLTTFASVPIKVTPHRSLNSCKGIIRSYDLAQLDEAELLQELKSQGVTGMRNIFQKRDGQTKKTNTIILTFGSRVLPKTIKAGYLNIPVDQFIPNPLRCFKCQKFGHHVSTCRQEAKCAKCGLGDHGTEPCTNPAKCINCSGNHPAFFNTCPVWQKEKEICKIKTTQNVTYPEARKILTSRTPFDTNSCSYARVAAQGTRTVSVGTQTDIVACKCPQRPILPADSVEATSLKTRDSQTDKNRPTTSFSQHSNKNSGSANKPGSRRTESLSPSKVAERGRTLSNNNQKQQGRPPKGSDDPIQLHNRFGDLEDVEYMDSSGQPPKSGKPNLVKIHPPL